MRVKLLLFYFDALRTSGALRTSVGFQTVVLELRFAHPRRRMGCHRWQPGQILAIDMAGGLLRFVYFGVILGPPIPAPLIVVVLLFFLLASPACIPLDKLPPQASHTRPCSS